MNAIIYIRVSTTEQVEGYSLKDQEEICLDYAKRNNINILKVFTEKENLQRPPIGQSLKDFLST